MWSRALPKITIDIDDDLCFNMFSQEYSDDPNYKEAKELFEER